MESREQEIDNAYQNGYHQDLTDAAIAVYKQIENCHTTTIAIGNLTKLSDLSCLKIEPKNMTR
ncbi:MAG: hypothetical protein ACREBI_04415 [Nitrosotalea sp.]